MKARASPPSSRCTSSNRKSCFFSARSRRKTSEALSSMTRIRAAPTTEACFKLTPEAPTLSYHLSGPYDPPLGRRPNVIERVTGHQRQHILAGRSEHPYIVGFHHLERLHFVHEIALQRRELNLVLDFQILQRAEERVPVPGEAHVTGISRQRRAGNMSDRAPESGFVDPFD